MCLSSVLTKKELRIISLSALAWVWTRPGFVKRATLTCLQTINLQPSVSMVLNVSARWCSKFGPLASTHFLSRHWVQPARYLPRYQLKNHSPYHRRWISRSVYEKKFARDRHVFKEPCKDALTKECSLFIRSSTERVRHGIAEAKNTRLPACICMLEENHCAFTAFHGTKWDLVQVFRTCIIDFINTN